MPFSLEFGFYNSKFSKFGVLQIGKIGFDNEHRFSYTNLTNKYVNKLFKQDTVLTTIHNIHLKMVLNQQHMLGKRVLRTESSLHV